MSAANQRPFSSSSQISQFCLKGVVATGTTLGVGSYGSVVEVGGTH